MSAGHVLIPTSATLGLMVVKMTGSWHLQGFEAGANIPCLQARTCLEIRNPCLNVRKSVLEILTMFYHYCTTRCHILTQKCSKFDFDFPRWRISQSSPYNTSYLDVRGPTSKGRGGDGKGREGGKRGGEGSAVAIFFV